MFMQQDLISWDCLLESGGEGGVMEGRKQRWGRCRGDGKRGTAWVLFHIPFFY